MKEEIEKMTEEVVKGMKPGTLIFVTIEEDLIAGMGLFLRYDEKEKRVYVIDAMFKSEDTDNKWIVDDQYFDLDYCMTFNVEAVVEKRLLDVLKRA